MPATRPPSPCAKRGSFDVIPSTPASQVGHALVVVTYKKAKWPLFTGTQMSKASAFVCSACGFIELYADSPSSLKPEKA